MDSVLGQFRHAERFASVASRCWPVCASLLGMLLLPHVAQSTELAPHRAVYEISLSEDQSSLARPASLSSLSGRMVYEVKGGPCEGYSLTQRLVTSTEMSEGQTLLEDLQLAGFEDADGKSFHFVSRRLIGRTLKQTLSGLAQLQDGATKLAMKQPVSEELVLPHEVLFPSGFAQKLIAAAKAGEALTSAYIFDGSDKVGEYFHATASIGPKRAGDVIEEPLRQFVSLDRWPVSVAYYDAGEATAGMTPLYEISTILLENGINGSLHLNFGSYALEAKLTDLEELPAPDCK